MPDPENPESSSEPRSTKRKRSEWPRSDFSSVVPAGQFTGEVKPRESRLEMQIRLKIEEAAAEHARKEEALKMARERWRDRIILLGGTTAMAVLGIYCLVLNVLPGQAAESKNWATSTLTAIATGFVGYVLGKAGRSL